MNLDCQLAWMDAHSAQFTDELTAATISIQSHQTFGMLDCDITGHHEIKTMRQTPFPSSAYE